MSLGIYIHIPFCRSRCNYCHFVSIPYHKAAADRYSKCLLDEVQSLSSSVEREEVDSIYFGGGTPSLAAAEHIEDILRECKRRFPVADNCEVSLEANPGTLSTEKMALLRKAGVNRISLGAQSFVDKELVSIGRLHNQEMIRQCRSQLRETGFVNLNLDLLLGLPDQTPESWRHSLQAAAALSVPHISVYMLDLDEPCALSAQVADGLIRVPEEEIVSDLYLETIDFLSGCGYVQYEISNFSRPGYSCRHNLKYWTRKPVYGLGLGSHSYDRQSRYANRRDIRDYFHAIETGRSPISWQYPVSALQALEETLFLGLRLTDGVNWSQLRCAYGDEALSRYEESLHEFSVKGWIEREDPVIRLTPSGMLFSNEIFQLFV